MLDCGDIGPVLAKIRDNLGIDFSQYREPTLRRRVSRRVVACNCVDLNSYLCVLDSNPDEYQNLISDLTIKYTEFFRDSWVYEILRQTAVPSLLNNAQRRRSGLSVWSAGCATGEEAYSLAALLLDIFGTDHFCNLNVLGTDLDPLAVEKARSGRYIKDYLPNIPEGWAGEYFVDDGRIICPCPDIRQMVRFEIHDLTAESAVHDMQLMAPDGFDIVFCRNVLMYLRRSTQYNVVNACSELLKSDGFLVIGTGEIIPAGMEDRLVSFNKKARIYRRIAEKASEDRYCV